MSNFNSNVEVTIFSHSINDPVNNFIVFAIVVFHITCGISPLFSCYYRGKLIAVLIKESPFIITHKKSFKTLLFMCIIPYCFLSFHLF
ncbi:hypothetical protein CUU54_06960 [Pectobacterium polaris]|nr:hypothetical protein [Pectobacterium polaris]MCU1794036.1 hypothetical protein [Pectobacterium polaris]PWD58056.1 hypothetical protein DF209_13935 [Pectobacterium polaris]